MKHIKHKPKLTQYAALCEIIYTVYTSFDKLQSDIFFHHNCSSITLIYNTHTNNHLTALCPGLPG